MQFLFYIWENWSLKKFKNFCKITQWLKDTVEIQTDVSNPMARTSNEACLPPGLGPVWDSNVSLLLGQSL